METKNLSDCTSVLTEIARIQSRLHFLKEITELSPYKNVKILFSGYTKIGVEQMLILDQSSLPFDLSVELLNLFNDSIDHYTRDLSSLQNHLKNI